MVGPSIVIAGATGSFAAVADRQNHLDVPVLLLEK